MHTVAAVIDDGVLTFDLAIPCEVFGVDRRDIVDPWYAFKVVAAGETPVRTQTGFSIDTPYRLHDLKRADTIIVPGWSDPDVPASDALCAALCDAHDRGARIVSLCTGAFVLGQAGLLDHRRATTHWLYVERLQARHPKIALDPDVLYVVDGRVMSSAGTAAGIDLCLHLVLLDHGAHIANRVARRIVMPPHRAGGQAQYIEQAVDGGKPLSIAGLLDWARDGLGDGVGVDELARHGLVSRRTLTRRFREATGLPPGEWLRRERILLTRELLETRDDPLSAIASQAGYASEATMRAHFASVLGISPRSYRATFRAPPRARALSPAAESQRA